METFIIFHGISIKHSVKKKNPLLSINARFLLFIFLPFQLAFWLISPILNHRLSLLREAARVIFLKSPLS